MNTEKEDKLYKSYLAGMTSLDEERTLEASSGDARSGEKVWFNFTRSHRKTAAVDLEKNIVSAIIARRGQTRRRIAQYGSIAAIMVLSVTLAVLHPWKPAEMSYEEKVIALGQALELVGTEMTAEADQEIIYEDEILIIYIK